MLMLQPAMGRNLDHLIQIRSDAEFVQLIDNWRRQQPDLPSRAEAIRRLVRLALNQG
jgi:hypothetical protein